LLKHALQFIRDRGRESFVFGTSRR
jgi:hypothetical protein